MLSAVVRVVPSTAHPLLRGYSTMHSKPPFNVQRPLPTPPGVVVQLPLTVPPWPATETDMWPVPVGHGPPNGWLPDWLKNCPEPRFFTR